MSEAGEKLKAFYREYRKSYYVISSLEDGLLTPQEDEGKWFLLLEHNSELIRAHYARNEKLLEENIYPFLRNSRPLDDELADIIIEENSRLFDGQTGADYLLHDDLATLVFNYGKERWPAEKLILLADSLRTVKGHTFSPQKTLEAGSFCSYILKLYDSSAQTAAAFEDPELMRSIYLTAVFRGFYYCCLYQLETGIPNYLELCRQYQATLGRFDRADAEMDAAAADGIEQARHETFLTAMNVIDIFQKRRIWDSQIEAQSGGMQQYRDLVTAQDDGNMLRRGGSLKLASASMSSLGCIYSRYIAGMITAEEYYSQLKQIYDTRDTGPEEKNLFGGHRLFCYIVVSVEMAYALEDTGRSIDERRGIQRRLFQNTIDYLCSMPQARDSHPYLKATYEYLGGMLPLIRDDGSLIELLFRLTVFQQTATSVHVLMVQLLAAAIAAGVLETKPELFAGTPGCPDSSSVLASQSEILSYIKNAALLHDIGKTPFWDIVDLQWRHITEGEFTALKRHPEIGSVFLSSSPDLKKYADVARDHHRYYNGKGGYPAGSEGIYSPYRIFTDIICIADCIDAGTDTLGRNYSRGKTFDMLFDELVAQAGSRYNPDIVRVISEGRVLKTTLRAITTWGRENICGRVYQNYIGEAPQDSLGEEVAKGQ